ncbi:hypothetical protein U1Q18_047528 [Sarracenia purpurea var. burkii]
MIIGLLLSSGVSLYDTTPGSMRSLSIALYQINATAHAFSEGAHSLSESAHSFSKSIHFFNKSIQVLSSDVYAYECTLKTINCQYTFRRTIIIYEKNIIEANNAYVRKQFPDMGEAFLNWHEEFRKAPATYAAQVLKDFEMGYDPDLNNIYHIAENRTVKSETLKNLNDRRLLLWISFFQGIVKFAPRSFYNRETMMYETSIPSNNALKVW